MHAVHILSGKIQMSPRCLLLGPVVRPPAAVRIGRRERERDLEIRSTVLTDGLRDTGERGEREREIGAINICAR